METTKGRSSAAGALTGKRTSRFDMAIAQRRATIAARKSAGGAAPSLREQLGSVTLPAYLQPGGETPQAIARAMVGYEGYEGPSSPGHNSGSSGNGAQSRRTSSHASTPGVGDRPASDFGGRLQPSPEQSAAVSVDDTVALHGPIQTAQERHDGAALSAATESSPYNTAALSGDETAAVGGEAANLPDLDTAPAQATSLGAGVQVSAYHTAALSISETATLIDQTSGQERHTQGWDASSACLQASPYGTAPLSTDETAVIDGATVTAAPDGHTAGLQASPYNTAALSVNQTALLPAESAAGDGKACDLQRSSRSLAERISTALSQLDPEMLAGLQAENRGSPGTALAQSTGGAVDDAARASHGELRRVGSSSHSSNSKPFLSAASDRSPSGTESRAGSGALTRASSQGSGTTPMAQHAAARSQRGGSSSQRGAAPQADCDRSFKAEVSCAGVAREREQERLPGLTRRSTASTHRRLSGQHSAEAVPERAPQRSISEQPSSRCSAELTSSRHSGIAGGQVAPAASSASGAPQSRRTSSAAREPAGDRPSANGLDAITGWMPYSGSGAAGQPLAVGQAHAHSSNAAGVPDTTVVSEAARGSPAGRRVAEQALAADSVSEVQADAAEPARTSSAVAAVQEVTVQDQAPASEKEASASGALVVETAKEAAAPVEADATELETQQVDSEVEAAAELLTEAGGGPNSDSSAALENQEARKTTSNAVADEEQLREAGVTVPTAAPDTAGATKALARQFSAMKAAEPVGIAKALNRQFSSPTAANASHAACLLYTSPSPRD